MLASITLHSHNHAVLPQNQLTNWEMETGLLLPCSRETSDNEATSERPTGPLVFTVHKIPIGDPQMRWSCYRSRITNNNKAEIQKIISWTSLVNAMTRGDMKDGKLFSVTISDSDPALEAKVRNEHGNLWEEPSRIAFLSPEVQIPKSKVNNLLNLNSLSFGNCKS